MYINYSKNFNLLSVLFKKKKQLDLEDDKNSEFY